MGETSLMMAAKNGSARQVSRLAREGVGVRLDDRFHEGDHIAVLTLIEKSGVFRAHRYDRLHGSARLVDKRGVTALHYAADGPGPETAGEYREKALILIGEGVDVDAADDQGETPLFKGLRSGHETFCWDRGADAGRQNSKGETIAAVALQTPQVRLFNKLRALLAGGGARNQG